MSRPSRPEPASKAGKPCAYDADFYQIEQLAKQVFDEVCNTDTSPDWSKHSD